MGTITIDLDNKLYNYYFDVIKDALGPEHEEYVEEYFEKVIFHFLWRFDDKQITAATEVLRDLEDRRDI